MPIFCTITERLLKEVLYLNLEVVWGLSVLWLHGSVARFSALVSELHVLRVMCNCYATVDTGKSILDICQRNVKQNVAAEGIVLVRELNWHTPFVGTSE